MVAARAAGCSRLQRSREGSEGRRESARRTRNNCKTTVVRADVCELIGEANHTRADLAVCAVIKVRAGRITTGSKAMQTLPARAEVLDADEWSIGQAPARAEQRVPVASTHVPLVKLAPALIPLLRDRLQVGL